MVTDASTVNGTATAFCIALAPHCRRFAFEGITLFSPHFLLHLNHLSHSACSQRDDSDVGASVLGTCRQQLPLPPGPWTIPFIGDTLRIMRSGLVDLSAERQKKYGPIHRTWLIGERNVFIADTASVRKVLNGEHTIAEGQSSTSITSNPQEPSFCTWPCSRSACSMHSKHALEAQ